MEVKQHEKPGSNNKKKGVEENNFKLAKFKNVESKVKAVIQK